MMDAYKEPEKSKTEKEKNVHKNVETHNFVC